jgi:hypothetical protein
MVGAAATPAHIFLKAVDIIIEHDLKHGRPQPHKAPAENDPT